MTGEAPRKPGRPKGSLGTKHKARGDVRFVPNPPENQIPPGTREAVAAAVAADPLHTASLMDLNWDGIGRGHEWLVHAEESRITEIMLAAGTIGWAEANRRGLPLADALKRAFAEMLLQMIPAVAV